jgi:CIC family chloride channel protein
VSGPGERRPAVLGLAYRLSFLSILVGVIAGLGAVAFRGLIALFHNLFFLGRFSFSYDANAYTPIGPWGPLVILAPVVGALVVAFLVKNFAPEARGHGVPEVIDATYYRRGIVRPIVALIKSVASALSIGSGGSVGREGPIIQIGASFGSTLGQIVPMPTWERITLVAAGAGGGIAATFNTPIGGILFAIEIMLHEVSVRTLVPVGISTVTATYIGRLFFGPNPSFVIPNLVSSAFNVTDPRALVSFVGLGVLMGLTSALFIKSLYGTQDLFEKWIPGSYYLRHGLGMLGVGITMYLCLRFLGHYYVQGVGYAAIQDILSGGLGPILLLLLLYVLKLAVTSVTLGSGASGGIFSPALYMGATLGAAYGLALTHFFPSLGSVGAPGFAVAGMAGVVGGATGAAMAAIVMIFEMTRDYGVIIPMAITVVISYGIRRALVDQSIYTLKLARRGHLVPQALQANFHYVQSARDVMATNVATVSPSTSFDHFLRAAGQMGEATHFLVGDPDQVFGVISKDAALAAVADRRPGQCVSEISSRNYIVVGEDTRLFEVLSRMRRERVPLALVSANCAAPERGAIIGVITREEVAASLETAVDLFAD